MTQCCCNYVADPHHFITLEALLSHENTFKLFLYVVQRLIFTVFDRVHHTIKRDYGICCEALASYLLSFRGFSVKLKRYIWVSFVCWILVSIVHRKRLPPAIRISRRQNVLFCLLTKLSSVFSELNFYL